LHFFVLLMKAIGFIIITVLFLSCSIKDDSVILPDVENSVEILLSDSAYNKLEAYRNKALENGVIDKSLKLYVKGYIRYKGKDTPIKLRLKGDWVDHLKTDKWSFRIKVTGNNAFLGLKSFSIQSPHTRSFLHEWFMHQLYLREGVLTTRYEFIPVIINGKHMGVYAMEEHFDKHLVEAKSKREGPILKFNEEGVWETRIGDPSSYHSLPYFAAAEVIPFKKNRTMKNPVLKKHFKTAQNLLLRFKAFDENIDEIFDLDKLAKFYALTDLANTDHALIWHNLRFYYNPVSRKVEPIAYDCYPEKVEMSANQPIYGYSKDKQLFPDFNYIHYHLFNNASFKALYISYLKKFSKNDYLNTVFNELDSSLTSIGNILSHEYPNSKFNKDFYYKNIKAIQQTLPEFVNSDVKYELQDYPFEDFNYSKTYYYNTGLKAYSSPFQDSSTNTVQLRNYHSSSVTIIGYGIKQNKDSIISLGADLTIKQQNSKSQVHSLALPKQTKTIFFIANNNMHDTLHMSISKWAFNKNLIDKVERVETTSISSSPLIDVNGISKLYVLKAGKHIFSEDLIVPKGWSFIIEKGCEINLINNAAIISYSPIHAEGSKSENILIHSTDSTGQGVSIIDNYGNSLLQNVVFRNLNTLTKYGWYLTGAVTFYQSNVVIESCTFESNFCEDAVNLVQSNFTFSNSIVQDTYSDGFDSDFCTGTITNSKFKNTGNDCIDLSGSSVEITGCDILNSGDKGISGGENSHLKVKTTNINGAKVAIASKDLSSIKVHSIAVQNVDFGYVIFQKKPEFGPAKVIVTNTNETVIKNKNLIDTGSLLINIGEFNIDTIKGVRPINVDSLYMEFK